MGPGGNSQGYCLYNSQDMNLLPTNGGLLPGPLGSYSQCVQGSIFRSREHRMVIRSCSGMEFASLGIIVYVGNWILILIKREQVRPVHAVCFE